MRTQQTKSCGDRDRFDRAICMRRSLPAERRKQRLGPDVCCEAPASRYVRSLQVPVVSHAQTVRKRCAVVRPAEPRDISRCGCCDGSASTPVQARGKCSCIRRSELMLTRAWITPHAYAQDGTGHLADELQTEPDQFGTPLASSTSWAKRQVLEHVQLVRGRESKRTVNRSTLEGDR